MTDIAYSYSKSLATSCIYFESYLEAKEAQNTMLGPIKHQALPAHNSNPSFISLLTADLRSNFSCYIMHAPFPSSPCRQRKKRPSLRHQQPIQLLKSHYGLTNCPRKLLCSFRPASWEGKNVSSIEMCGKDPRILTFNLLVKQNISQVYF